MNIFSYHFCSFVRESKIIRFSFPVFFSGESIIMDVSSEVNMRPIETREFVFSSFYVFIAGFTMRRRQIRATVLLLSLHGRLNCAETNHKEFPGNTKLGRNGEEKANCGTKPGRYATH